MTLFLIYYTQIKIYYIPSYSKETFNEIKLKITSYDNLIIHLFILYILFSSFLHSIRILPRTPSDMRTHAFMNHLVQSNRYNVQWATALRPSRLAATGTLERFSSRLQWGAPWPPCAASVNPENHLWGWRWRPYHLRLATFRRVWCLWSMARTLRATLSHPRSCDEWKTRDRGILSLLLRSGHPTRPR